MNEPLRSYDVIIVGGGISGLTSSAYLSQYGYRTILFEQQDIFGGLVNSFDYKGFHLDGGIRSIESSGVVKPLIRDLGLNIDLIRSHVTLGIKDQVIPLSDQSNLEDYQKLLISLFPNDEKDILRIFKRIQQILKYMDILYGIDNPMIVDFKKNPGYVTKTLIPWLFKFLPTLTKIDQLNVPVEKYLKKYTKNQALIDMIAQHFFKDTPAFFALGYFSIYFDYHYPRGGTGKLPLALENYIKEHGGILQPNTKIVSLDLETKTVTDHQGNQYAYHKLIWAADMNRFYQAININQIKAFKLKNKIDRRMELLKNKTGAESVLSVYALVNLSPSYFKERSSEHFFYTPKGEGLNHLSLPKAPTMASLLPSLKQFLDLNTYEISIPVLRDESLAPIGQTALIISILLDYETISYIDQKGYYKAFKTFIESYFVDILSDSIYPNLKDYVIETFSSTPLTFNKRVGTTDGAIFGWSYTNKVMPAVHKMSNITKSIQTGLPDIYQAGQWTFSPAGVPISIITGKLAADSIKKHLKKNQSTHHV